jgi:hypothetical protein
MQNKSRGMLGNAADFPYKKSGFSDLERSDE